MRTLCEMQFPPSILLIWPSTLKFTLCVYVCNIFVQIRSFKYGFTILTNTNWNYFSFWLERIRFSWIFLLILFQVNFVKELSGSWIPIFIGTLIQGEQITWQGCVSFPRPWYILNLFSQYSLILERYILEFFHILTSDQYIPLQILATPNTQWNPLM